MVRNSLRAWALAIGLAAGGCDDEPTDEPDDASTTVEPIWSGCWLIDDAQRCQLAGARLRVWLPEAEPSWRWSIDDRVAEPTIEDADDGVRFTFDASIFEDEAHTLVLRDAESERPLFTLELVPDPFELGNFGFGDEVESALASSSSEDRGALAEALLAGPSGSVLDEVARVHYARILAYDGRDPGRSADAVLAVLEREEQLAAKHGLWGVRCRAALVGLHWGTFRQDPELIGQWGRLEAQCRERSADLGAYFDQQLGLQALHEGAYAEAQARLSSVQTVTARVLPEETARAGRELMDLYVRTGRWSEALRELESLQALFPLGTCERAQAESSIGYARVRARQSDKGDLGDPEPGLEAALDAHSPGERCENVALYAHDLAKLGYAAGLRGDTAALRGYVDRLSKERLDGKYLHQGAELKLQLAVAEQRFSEVPGLSSAMDTLAKDGEPEAQWRRQMLLAQAAIGQGDNAAAQTAYVAAEAVLDELWAGVSSYALRARWLSAYRRSALGLMRLRLDVADLEGAACAARSARLRALDPRDGSGIARGCERAWARGENEVVFLIVPETDVDWYVFEISDERVLQVTRAQAPDSETDAGWWDPWTNSIRGAARVRVLASGAALRSPLHQQAWRGEPLIRQRSVTFGLDLDPSQTQAAPASPAASVLFADADPYRALARYSGDVRLAHTALERGGWAPRWIETAARPPDMADAVPAGGLLVYYGHGERMDVAGSALLGNADDVGSTALLVAPETHWGVDEVSALHEAPRWAVLLGCDVAFPDVNSWSGGLNLAHALLLAGTQEVLAATGPLDAASAAGLALPLFAAEASPRFQLSDALHQVWAAPPHAGADPPLDTVRVWSR